MTTNNETPIQQEIFYQLFVTLDRPLVCGQCGETDQWYGVMEAGLHQPTSYACACGGSHLDPSEVNYWKIVNSEFGELMKEVLETAYGPCEREIEMLTHIGLPQSRKQASELKKWWRVYEAL